MTVTPFRRIVIWYSLAWLVLVSPGARVSKLDAAGHWAFQRVGATVVPPVRNQAALRSSIDAFVENRLETLDLTLRPEADQVTLIRRECFDLTGLPPEPYAVDSFLADDSPTAYQRMVERYLASPRYGERWANHWLDVVGYADSNGRFSSDSNRPLAYRYRDYVIRSFNSDKPYDRFVWEQVAGDEMVGYKSDGDVTPDMVEALTATHFLRNAQDGTGESDGFVHGFAQPGVIGFDSRVGISFASRAVVERYETNAAFDESACQEAILSEGLCVLVVEAI